MSKVKIRKGKIEDLGVIQELGKELTISDFENSDGYLNVDWPFKEFGEKYFKSRIDGGKYIALVAENDDEVIGYLTGDLANNPMSRKLEKSAEIESMCVSKNFRSNGIGKDLVKQFVTWSKEQGADNLNVTAYFNNKRAVEFYEECGFGRLVTKLELIV